MATLTEKFADDTTLNPMEDEWKYRKQCNTYTLNSKTQRYNLYKQTKANTFAEGLEIQFSSNTDTEDDHDWKEHVEDRNQDELNQTINKPIKPTDTIELKTEKQHLKIKRTSDSRQHQKHTF